MIPLLATWVTVCSAHPFDARFYGHATKIVLDTDLIEVQYTIEVPQSAIRDEQRIAARHGQTPSEMLDSKHDEIKSGLRLLVDGAAPRTVELPVSVERPESGFSMFEARFQAPLDPGPHEIRFEVGNAPDEVGFFSTTVLVGSDWEVVESSLFEREDGRLTRSHDGRWRFEDDARVTSLVIRPRIGATAWLARRFESGRYRALADATAAPDQSLFGGVLASVVGVAGLVVITIAAQRSWRRTG